MTRRIRRFLIAWGPVAGLATGCVSSGDLERVHSQVSQVEHQVLQLQMQAATKQEMERLQTTLSDRTAAVVKSVADTQLQLEALSSQIDQLRAQLEDTNYRLAQLSQQIAATNQELKALRTASAASNASGPSAEGEALPSPSDPQDLYRAAYNDYLRGNYDLAIRQFQDYLRTFPNTELSDNATYWIGECHYRQGNYRQATAEYDQVLNRYPRSDKLASALLKKGYAHIELGERAQGILHLQQVIREHPGSDEANLARQRLRELGVDAR